MASRDWGKLKAEYIAGKDAPELARKYGIPLATVESRASREKWGAERKEVASQVQAELPGAVAGEVVGQAASVARQNLADLDAYRRTLVELLPVIRKRGGPVGATSWIENYRKLQDAQRLALGLTPTNESSAKGGGSDDEDAESGSPAVLPAHSPEWRALAGGGDPVGG